MRRLSALALLPIMLLLGAASRALSGLNTEAWFLGLSSDFWAGVCLGGSVAFGCWLIALVVKQLVESPYQSP